MAKTKKTTSSRVANYNKKSFGQAPTAADLLSVPNMMKPPKPSSATPETSPPAKETPSKPSE